MRAVSGWVLTLALGLALILAIVWTRFLWGPMIINTAVARQGHLDVTVAGTAVLIRDERLYASPLAGTLRRQVDEGTLVSPGSPVLTVDGDLGGAPGMQAQLEYLDARTAQYRAQNQGILLALSQQAEEVLSDVQETLATMKSYPSEAVGQDLAAALRSHAVWQEQWDDLWTGYAEIISERDRLLVWIEPDDRTLSAPERGFVTYRYDGLEDVLRLGGVLPGPARLADWGIQETRLLKDGDQVDAGRVVFRITDPGEVGFYLTVPDWRAALAEHGQTASVILPSGDEIRVRLDDVSPPQGGEIGLLFTTDRFLPELALNRYVDITVRLRRVSGTILPASSIVVRGGQSGVWLWYRDRPQWQPVNVRASIDGRVAVDGVSHAVSVVENPRFLFLLGVR